MWFSVGRNPLRVDSPYALSAKPGLLAACLAPHRYLSGACYSRALSVQSRLAPTAHRVPVHPREISLIPLMHFMAHKCFHITLSIGVPGATEQKTTGVASFRGGRFAENDGWRWTCIALHSHRIPEPVEPRLTEKSSFRLSLFEPDPLQAAGLTREEGLALFFVPLLPESHIREGVFYPTRCASPQGTLIPLTPQDSLVVYRTRTTRRRAPAPPPMPQLLLFEVLPTG
jgi:hypothetical protein